MTNIIDELYAIFVLKMNDFSDKEIEDFYLRGYFFDQNYSLTEVAKKYKFQWKDRAHFELPCWTGHIDDIDQEEDQHTITLHGIDSENMGNIYDLIGEDVMIVPMERSWHKLLDEE